MKLRKGMAIAPRGSSKSERYNYYAQGVCVILDLTPPGAERDAELAALEEEYICNERAILRAGEKES
jgi:hypothetical protein